MFPAHRWKSLLEKTPLPPDEVAAIGAKIAFALHDIHRQHVIHLDLKPGNVILRGDEAVLIDFGLARHDQLPDLVQEEAEGPVGTGAYISPEQVLGERTDPRSDLFALGVILYLLATGERPVRRTGTCGKLAPTAVAGSGAPTRAERRRSSMAAGDHSALPGGRSEKRYATAAQLAFDLQHPDQVALTERAARTRRDGFLTVAWRRLRKARNQPPRQRRALASHLANAPIVLAAIDLEPGHERLSQAIALAVRRVLMTEPNARLACINILKIARLALDKVEDAQGRNPHLGRLVELKHWARGIPVSPERITYHVFEFNRPCRPID